MQMSQKAEYAVRAALDLALNAGPHRGARSSDVARRTGVPLKFLEAILLDLRKGGLVSSKRGPNGGHWLAMDPATVTVGSVIEAIDGPSSGPTVRPRGDLTPADVCLRALWGRVDLAIQSVVDEVTLDDLKRQADTQGAADFTI